MSGIIAKFGIAATTYIYERGIKRRYTAVLDSVKTALLCSDKIDATSITKNP